MAKVHVIADPIASRHEADEPFTIPTIHIVPIGRCSQGKNIAIIIETKMKIVIQTTVSIKRQKGKRRCFELISGRCCSVHDVNAESELPQVEHRTSAN
jgi:hypothetical protein